MAKIIKHSNEKLENIKLIGKKYQGTLNIPTLWSEWFQNSLFDQIENLMTNKIDNGYVGLLRWNPKALEQFEYWIGVFVDKNTEVPVGYEEVFLPDGNVDVYYIKGIDDPNLYAKEDSCFNQTDELQHTIKIDDNGFCYSFERYNCPRFTETDDNNEVILDYGIIINE